MRTALLTAALLCGLATAARANVIYTFTTTSFGTTFTGPGAPMGLPLNMTFDLSDAVVAAGHFSLSAPGSNPFITPVYSGDVGGFTRLVIQGEQVTPTFLFGRISTALTFNASGDITSSSVQFFGVSEGANVSGTGATASGFVGSDSPRCNSGLDSQRCFVSGNWTHTTAPEPASLVLLSVGLFGLGVARLTARHSRYR